MTIGQVCAMLIMLPMVSGAAIAGAVTDRELAREGRLRDLETQREAARMQRDGEHAQRLDEFLRSLHRCRCRLTH
jgi:hypothetical protein